MFRCTHCQQVKNETELSKNRYGVCKECVDEVLRNDPTLKYACTWCGVPWVKNECCPACKAMSKTYTTLRARFPMGNRIEEVEKIYLDRYAKGYKVPKAFLDRRRYGQ